MNKITESYRQAGALLSVSKRDARVLINERKIGLLDRMGDTESGLLGVHIPGHAVDRIEPSRLFLIGGIEIIRYDAGDAIVSFHTINIDGLFDE